MQISVDFESTLWTGIKAYCPICKRTFTGWYCPSCGLPKKNSKYALYKGYMDSLHNCDKYHFRPEFSQFEDFQLCDKCYTTNPYNAKFCRNCGKKISPSRSVTKDAHSWVDLGLSVLWATETMDGKFRWMDCNANFGNNLDDCNYNYIGNGKDAASELWGHKWRTPTKEEFEELFTKCRWERCIDPISKKYTLKATGPNGNSIILTLDRYGVISLWTSTEYTAKYDGRAAYAFLFNNDIKIETTLTEKQKKEMEFEKLNATRFKLDIAIDITLGYLFSKGCDSRARKLEEEEKRRKYPEYEKTIEQQRQILDAMGDDRQERENNKKKDKEILDNLWINAPVKFSFNEDLVSNNKRKYNLKRCILQILPVADRNWKGKL